MPKYIISCFIVFALVGCDFPKIGSGGKSKNTGVVDIAMSDTGASKTVYGSGNLGFFSVTVTRSSNYIEKNELLWYRMRIYSNGEIIRDEILAFFDYDFDINNQREIYMLFDYGDQNFDPNSRFIEIEMDIYNTVDESSEDNNYLRATIYPVIPNPSG